MDADTILSELFVLADGEIVGRVRLQKMIYLLDAVGLSSGFTYDYHHFGPYSEELAGSLMHHIASENVLEVNKSRFTDGARYSVFQLKNTEAHSLGSHFGNIDTNVAHSLVKRLKTETSTVLELASTIHWLKHYEDYDEWEDELLSRKRQKVTADRKAQAIKLLEDLGIQP